MKVLNLRLKFSIQKENVEVKKESQPKRNCHLKKEPHFNKKFPTYKENCQLENNIYLKTKYSIYNESSLLEMKILKSKRKFSIKKKFSN